MKQQTAIERVRRLVPDFAAAMQHDDVKRAEFLATAEKHRLVNEIYRRTNELEQDVAALSHVLERMNGSLEDTLKLRMAFGWVPAEEQVQAMRTLGIEVNIDAN